MDVTDPDGGARVYPTVTCGQCWALKHWLKCEGISYTELDVEHDAGARRFMRRVAGGYLSVPTVLFPNGRVLVEPTRAQVQAALAR